MLGPLDYVLWLACALAQAAVVVCAFRRRTLLRYSTLNLYMAAAFVVTVGRYFIFARYGLSSPQYSYFYWYSDSLLTLFLFFALMNLYAHVFSEMGVHSYLRFGALLLLGLTAWFSYGVVAQSGPRLLTRFVVELSQNLYFVGVVLTYLLWGAMMKLRETRTRLIQLISALGIYFSGLAANYALFNMYHQYQRQIWQFIPPVMAIWLPLAWSYTFLKVPEEARLATARVAVHHR